MPRGDKTGPNGQGALTGRGLGDCNTNNTTFAGYGRGNGRGRGSARGLGRSNGRVNVSAFEPSLEDEKAALQSRLNEIDKQINNK